MLSEDHTETAQGQVAQEKLLEMADVYERVGSGIRRARSMSVCCDSDVRGQVTSELFGMNGIAVHAVTLDRQRSDRFTL